MEHDSGTDTVEYEGDDLEALSTMHRYREWIVNHFEPYLTGEAVEIGAGIGNIAHHIAPHVSSLLLVEPSSRLVETMEIKFSENDKIAITRWDFDGFVNDTASEVFDCVILVNILEHIEDDENALKECRRILRRNGKLLILVPALPFLFSDLDSKHGHFRRYARGDLMSKVRDANFDIIYSSYFDMLGIIPWYLLNTLGGAVRFDPTLMSIYDKIFVPITRWFESRISPPIGKNLRGCPS